jgi:LmbE family N-acetylglucosaminyl deacetylase
MKLKSSERPASDRKPVSESRGGVLAKYAGKTVLAVGAHPDDLELGVGGTLKRLSEAGARVVMAVVSIPSRRQSRIREATAAAKILGCEVRFLTRNRSIRVEDLKNHELVRMIDRLVEELSPAAVITHCLANLHTDHKLVHDACMATQRLKYFDMFCFLPTSSHAISVSFNPHAYIDITRVIDAKMRAISVHSSQFSERGLKIDHYRETCSRAGRMVGVDYAEGLEVVRLRVN